MSGREEAILRLGLILEEVEARVNTLIADLEQQKPAALSRLIKLEKAFHLWESCFHILASTSFHYYCLESSIKELLEGSLVNPLTIKRKAEVRRLSNRYDDKHVCWRFEDEPDVDLASDPTTLPQVARDFLTEMKQVEEFALQVAQLVIKQDEVARVRVRMLEQAFYLFRVYRKYVASPSFRLSYFRHVCYQLSKSRYFVGAKAHLDKRFDPPVFE
jgi:hypothetical protein